MLNADLHRKLADEVANRSLTLVVFEVGVLILIALTALIGNSCVLYVFYKTSRLRCATSYYIITLAVADIIRAAVLMPFTMACTVSGGDVLGPQIGKAQAFMSMTHIHGTLMIIAMIGINRYCCVARRNLFKRMFGVKLVLVTIAGAFAFPSCVLVFTLYMGWNKFEFYPGMQLYYIAFSAPIPAVILLAFRIVVFLCIPLGTIIICYRKIYQIVKQHNANVSNTLRVDTTTASNLLNKEEIHLSISLLALVCGFVICWIPAIVVYVLTIFVKLPRSVELLGMYAVTISTTITPIIYNVFNKPFRKEFKTIFRPKPSRVAPALAEQVNEAVAMQEKEN